MEMNAYSLAYIQVNFIATLGDKPAVQALRDSVFNSST